MNFDAIVIGSGISGACVARELSRYQLRVAVLEKGYDLCVGATRGNSATVHSGHDAAYGTAKARYNVLGNAMYDKLCAELSVPFVRNGTILFATSEKDMEEVRRLKRNADKNGVPVCASSPARSFARWRAAGVRTWSAGYMRRAAAWSARTRWYLRCVKTRCKTA